MIKDIHFNFTGFGNSEGYCHLRVAQKKPSSKIVVICSQYKNYYGTSPTNALELIAEKFFYDVVNGGITGIALPVVPTYEKWHDDVTWVDRLLVKLWPSKYGERFKSVFLNIPEMFNSIIWIERYPAGTSFFKGEDDYSLVSMGQRGDPHWHARPDDGFILNETGFSLAELFVAPEIVDLKQTQQRLAELEDVKKIALHSGNRSIRWTKDLLDYLPAKILNSKFATGREGDENLWELQIQGLIEEIFAVVLPAADLFDHEYGVSKLLGIYKSGDEKKCDIVVFEPESNKPCVMIEVKRSSGSIEGIVQDLAKLLLYSKALESDAYFLLCGNAVEIQKLAEKLEYLLSFSNKFEDRYDLDRLCLVSGVGFIDEYKNHLNNFGISTLNSRLVGASADETVFLWNISHAKEGLLSNKPYYFRLIKSSMATDCA